MREALNSNPMVQAAVIAVLLIGGVIFILSSGGGEKGESAGAESALAPSESEATATVSEPGPVVSTLDAPKLPRPVLRAYDADRTVVLVVVHDGGIDDRLVKSASKGLAGVDDASVFVVPAHQIARYAAITEGVGVERVPALVVVTPKSVAGATPTASVSYGVQSPETVAQAVRDANYKGRTLEYHP